MKRSPLLPIFLIVLVDVLGFTIVIPLLGFYAEKFGASPLVATTLVSVYAACSLLSTPIIGNLSDRYGRRRLLLISQAGTCAGFLMLAVSSALWMVFVGRILDGITAGNMSIAQAYISDHTKPQDRAKAFGVIGVAFGIGFMFGPGLGGLLGKYGLHVPFIVAASLSAFSIFCTYTLLSKEAKPTGTDAELPAGRRPGAFDIATYAAYFRRPGLGSLYVQFFCFAFAFSCFTSGFALFAERRFTSEYGVARVANSCTLAVDDKLDLPHAKTGILRLDGQPLAYGTQWTITDPKTIAVHGDACARLDTAKLTARFPWTAQEVGLLFMFSGFLGALMQGGLLGRLVTKFGEPTLVMCGFGLASLAYVLLGFAFTIAMCMLVAIVSACGNGMLRPVITSRISQIAGSHEQGVALGISGSLSSFAMMIAPPTGGFMINQHWLVAWAFVPATVAALGLLIAVVSRATPAGTMPKPELSSAP